MDHLWTPGEIKRLISLREAGDSFAEISRKLCIGRPACIGKFHRVRRRTVDQTSPPRSDERERSEVTRRAKRRPVSLPPIGETVAADDAANTRVSCEASAGPRARNGSRRGRPRRDAVNSGRGVTVAELKPHHCRWPSGDGPYTFCAAPRDGGSSYCATHRAVARRPL